MNIPPQSAPANIDALPKGEIKVWLLESYRSSRHIEEIDADFHGMFWALVSVLRVSRDSGGIVVAFGGSYGWYHPDNVRLVS